MSSQRTDSEVKTSSNILNRQIGLYSLAATVAGVSLIALTQPAAGEVVVSRKTIPIPVSTEGVPHPVKISMANNGVNNFSFVLSSLPPNSNQSFSFRGLDMGGATNHAGEVIAGGFRTYTPALPPGARIGPSATLASVGAEVENTYAGRSYRQPQG